MFMHVLPAQGRLAAGVCCLYLVGAFPGFAAQMEAPSRIDSVSVFADGAQATRIAEIDLPQGATSLVFADLPGQLDPASLRVSGSGAGDIVITSVQSRVEPADREQMPASLADKLQKLTDERQLLRQTQTALRAKREMIERYAKASPEKLGADSAPLQVGDWSNAWAAVGEGLTKTAEETQAVQMRLREVEREIAALRASHRPAPSGPRTRRVVTVDVEAEAAGKARFELTYTISGARWRPVYDARLQTSGPDGKPVLELVRRAEVIQSTGEAWTGVTMRLSALSARRRTQAPEVRGERVRFDDPVSIPRPVPGDSSAARRAAPRLSQAPAIAVEPSAEAAPLREAEATLDAGAYTAVFRVSGRADVPADGSARVLRIATMQASPELLARAAPALDPTAYLEASFVNDSEVALLPGPVSLHRDGVFVGSGAIRPVAPGGRVTLGFGADDRIEVKRVPVSRSERGPGWVGNNRTEVQDFSIQVRNRHRFPVAVRIVDRIPISENDAIAVSALPTNTTPDETRVDGRRGVQAWRFTLGPSQERELRIGWQVQWPADKRITTDLLPD